MRNIRFILAAGLVLASVAIAVAQKTASPNSNTKKLKTTLSEAGKFYLSSKRYDAAIQQWKALLALDPKDKKAMRLIKKTENALETEGSPAGKYIRVISLPKDLFYSPPSPAALSMDECIDIAVKNSIPLQMAAKSTKLAEMRLWEARRNMLPTAGIRLEEYSGRVSGREYHGRKQYIEGQQPVFRGGELFFTVKQAEVNLEVVRNDYAKTKNELVLQVKKAYNSLLKSKENLRFQEDLASQAEKISQMVNKEYDAGIASRLEFLNVSSQASQIKFQLISARSDIAVAELMLKQAMSVDPRYSIDIQPIDIVKHMEINFEDVLRAAMMNRPEMKINLLTIAYYEYEKKITKAKLWPKVDVMGNWGLAKEEFDSEDRLGPNSAGTFDVDQKLEQQWYAGFKVSMPFWGSTAEYSWTKEQFVPVVSAFQGTEAVTNVYKFNFLDTLKYYSEKKSSEIDFDRARQELMKIKQDIMLEVRESCFNYEKAFMQLETADAKIKYQERDVEFNKLKREMDEALDSNVIESLIKLAQEKFGYAQAVAECFTAQASIDKAVGIENYVESSQAQNDE